MLHSTLQGKIVFQCEPIPRLFLVEVQTRDKRIYTTTTNSRNRILYENITNFANLINSFIPRYAKKPTTNKHDRHYILSLTQYTANNNINEFSSDNQ